MTAVIVSINSLTPLNQINISNVKGIIKTSSQQLQTIKGSSSNLEFYSISKTIGITLTIKNNIGDVLEGDNDVISLESDIKNIINYSEQDPFSRGKY